MVEDEWLNMLQEEVANAVTGAGIALRKDLRNQLYSAIVQIAVNIASGSAPDTTGFVFRSGDNMSGSLTTTGHFIGGQGVFFAPIVLGFGAFSNPAYHYMQYVSGWAWAFNRLSGELQWVSPASGAITFNGGSLDASVQIVSQAITAGGFSVNDGLVRFGATNYYYGIQNWDLNFSVVHNGFQTLALTPAGNLTVMQNINAGAHLTSNTIDARTTLFVATNTASDFYLARQFVGGEMWRFINFAANWPFGWDEAGPLAGSFIWGDGSGLGSTNMRLGVLGDLNVKGPVYHGTQSAMAHNVTDVRPEDVDIMRLRPRHYRYGGVIPCMGFIYEELEPVSNELAHDCGAGVLGNNDAAILAVAVAHIKRLMERVTALEGRR